MVETGAVWSKRERERGRAAEGVGDENGSEREVEQETRGTKRGRKRIEKERDAAKTFID